MEGSIVQEARKDNVNPFGNQQNSTAMDVRSVCDPAKMFFTSKFSFVLFCNHTCKTETGTANRWETTNSKPLGPIIMTGRSETPSSSQIIFITLFFAGGQCCCTFYQPWQPAQLCEAKTIFLSQTVMCSISSSKFTMQDHHQRCSTVNP
jgi:hypothetical protein